MSNGNIVQCIGPVVDIQFPRDKMPNIYDALTLVESGEKSFAQIKSEMRTLLQQRPFNLDLVQLQTIPLFNGLPDCIAKHIWIEAFLVSFEAKLPSFLYFKLEYGNKLDWKTLKCVLDGCENPELFEMLKEREKELIVDDIVLEWLLENIEIDK